MKQRYCNVGFGLASVIVSLGVASLSIYSISSLMTRSMSSQASLELRSDKEAIKRMILNTISCADTLPTGACTPFNVSNSPLTIYKRLGANVAVFISSSSQAMTKLGKYTLRAECNDTGTGVRVRAARLSSSGNLLSTNDKDFVPDPLFEDSADLSTKTVAYANAKWSSSRSLLFGSGIDLCVQDNPSYKKIISGRVNVFFNNGDTNSNLTHVSFPFTCNNPRVVTQTLLDSVFCNQGGIAAKCLSTYSSTSEDLTSRAYNISTSGFNAGLSTVDGVCVGATAPGQACTVSPAYPIDYVVTCDP